MENIAALRIQVCYFEPCSTNVLKRRLDLNLNLNLFLKDSLNSG